MRDIKGSRARREEGKIKAGSLKHGSAAAAAAAAAAAPVVDVAASLIIHYASFSTRPRSCTRVDVGTPPHPHRNIKQVIQR